MNINTLTPAGILVKLPSDSLQGVHIAMKTKTAPAEKATPFPTRKPLRCAACNCQIKDRSQTAGSGETALCAACYDAMLCRRCAANLE